MAESDYNGSPVHIYLHRPMPFQGTKVYTLAGRCGDTLGSLLAVTRISSVCDDSGVEIQSPLLGKTIMLNTADIRLVVMTTVGAPAPSESYGRA